MIEAKRNVGTLKLNGSTFYKILALSLFLFLSTNAQIVPTIDWVQIYDGISGGIDLTNDAKMDKDNNLYLAGRSAGVDSSQDLLILKYSNQGELKTEFRYVSAPYSWEEANSIALDSSNNLYCIGRASFGTISFYTIIQKYSSSGSLVWSKNFENHSEGEMVTVDSDNDVITSYSQSGICITKYSSSGDSLWTIKIKDDTSTFRVNKILTDENSNIYVALTQYYDGGDVPNTLVNTYKFDKNGNFIWRKSFDGNYTSKILFDKNGKLLQLIGDAYHGSLVKMNQDGEVEWQIKNNELVVTDLGVDSNNNLIVTGYGVLSDSYDYVIKKYSFDGVEKWTQIFNSEEKLNEYASALVIDKDNNIYVTGSSHNSISKGVSYTVKYGEDGTLLWQQKFDAPHSIFENASYIFLDDSNSVFVGGDVADSTNGWNFFALKIKQVLKTSLGQGNNELPAEYILSQNFPNPFNPTTLIQYALPYESSVSITVYNTLGQIVKTFNEGAKASGSYSLNFNGEGLSSGVYFYSINAVSVDGKQNYRATKKMLLMK